MGNVQLRQVSRTGVYVRYTERRLSLEVIDDYEILTYYSIDDMIIVKAGLLTLGVLCETHGVVTQELLNDINSMHDMLQEVFNRECEEKDKSRNYEQLAMTE